MHKRLIDETDKYIRQFIEEGIGEGNNLEYIDKLIDIQKDAYKIERMKEEEEMYGNYGGRRYDDYRGEHHMYDTYGRRERDSRGRYKGHEHLDRMYDHYGRYMEGRERYGANEDTKRSLEYMLHSMEDFARMLREDAQSQEEVDMIRQSAQRIANM